MGDFKIIIYLVIAAMLLVVLGIRGAYMQIKYRRRISNMLSDLFSRHNKLSVGMSETEMLQTMDFRFDKTCEEDKTTYRYVFVTKGSSGETHGYLSGSMGGSMGGSMYGESHGYSEQHDESCVIVECKDNKVTKVSPYNMNDIRVPTEYGRLLRFANDLGIKYKD